MVKSGKTTYSKLNYIYIPSGRALRCTFYSLYSLLLYIPKVINKKILLARVLLAIFSIPFFVFI